MNTIFRSPLIWLIALAQAATAGVITSNAVSLYPQSDLSYGANYMLVGPAAGSIFIDAQFSAPSTVTVKASSLGNMHLWFLAEYGDVFTEATKWSYPNLMTGEAVVVTEDNYFDRQFYVAVNAGTNWMSPEVFGWALLQFDDVGELVLLESAAAENEGGIIVGTYDAVPEPSTCVLLLTAATATLWHLRRRR